MLFPQSRCRTSLAICRVIWQTLSCVNPRSGIYQIQCFLFTDITSTGETSCRRWNTLICWKVHLEMWPVIGSMRPDCCWKHSKPSMCYWLMQQPVVYRSCKSTSRKYIVFVLNCVPHEISRWTNHILPLAAQLPYNYNRNYSLSKSINVNKMEFTKNKSCGGVDYYLLAFSSRWPLMPPTHVMRGCTLGRPSTDREQK